MGSNHGHLPRISVTASGGTGGWAGRGGAGGAGGVAWGGLSGEDGEAGERVFKADDLLVPMIGIFRIFDPFLRATLAAIEEFSNRLESVGMIMNAVEVVNAKISDLYREQQLNKDPSEMN